MERLTKGWLRNQRGATMVEYALLVALIALLVVGAAKILGGQISTVFTNIKGALGG